MNQSFHARIRVTLKSTVNDPEGDTIARALARIGLDQVVSLRVGKYFDVELMAANRDEAASQVREMCDKLLANPVIEQYAYEISDSG